MALIGINGKIGSGKDTIGKIIQYIDSESDIKFEDWVKSKIHLSGYDIGLSSMYDTHPDSWKIKKFAAKVKEIASILTGIPTEKFEDQEFKKTEMSEEWAVNGMPITIRKFLQIIGTEGIRDNVHPNAWVNALFYDYNPEKRWIITDLRFPNELLSIQKRGGITIRVTRANTIVSNHISETALDNFVFDEKVVNDGTINELVEKIRQIMIKRNFIK